MDTVICKELIVTTLTRRGKGIEHSTIRVITEIWDKDGNKIAENDPTPDTFVAFDLIHFARFLKEKKWDADKADMNVINKWLDSIK